MLLQLKNPIPATVLTEEVERVRAQHLLIDFGALDGSARFIQRVNVDGREIQIDVPLTADEIADLKAKALAAVVAKFGPAVEVDEKAERDAALKAAKDAEQAALAAEAAKVKAGKS